MPNEAIVNLKKICSILPPLPIPDLSLFKQVFEMQSFLGMPINEEE
jgi:hypothetical protein